MTQFSRRKLITYIAIVISVLVVICIFPLKLIRYGYTAKSDEIMVSESDPISVEYNMTQMFDGVGGELKSVDLYVCNDMSNQIITFRLYDYNHEQIYEQFYTVPNDFIAPDFVHIPIRYEMEEGQEYSFIVEGLTADLYAAYEDRATTTSPINYFMAYGGAEVPEYSLIVRYNFACPFSWWQILLSVAILAFICFISWFVLGKIGDKEISVKKTAQIVVNPIVIIAALSCAYVIQIKKIFGIDTKNNLFLIMGIWMLLALIFYIVNFTRISIPDNLYDKLKAVPIGRTIRVISIATVLWYCYEYMNGLYDIFHYYSTAKLFIAFGFVLFSTYRRKEVLNIFNAIWLVIGPIAGYIVYKPQIGVELYEELYRYYGWLVLLGGFVVINIIYSIVMIARKQIRPKKINLWFAVPFAVFAIGICILSNTRFWTWQLVLMCVLLAYRLCVMENGREFTKELCVGIILNFYMMVFYSLRHRPYYFYQYYRYNMGYHTVTVTAYYMALIVTAAWMRLFSKYLCKSGLTRMIPQLFTFGMAASYLVFTMSRTGFLSVGVMIFFALTGGTVLYVEKAKLKNAFSFIGIMAGAFIYMFPITFFLTDVMPRIANDPVVFEFEVRDFTFTEGMPYSDPNYMTIEQFVSEFSKKVFNKDLGITVADWDNPFVIQAYAAEKDTVETSYVIEDSTAWAEAGVELEEKDVTDMSNGRFDIFKSYVAELNLWGHDEMGTLLPNGEIAVHAHNSFIQVAFDHGIIFGIYFVLFVGYVLILSLVRAYNNKKQVSYFLCPIIIVCFCMASMVEWVMHPCNPLGLSLFLAMIPLFIKEKTDEESN